MADISKPCNAFNGYNFKQDLQDRIGHMTGLKIGETTIEADQTVKNPVDVADVKVVLVLSDYFWAGGAAEPMNFSGQMSAGNKQKLVQMLHGDMNQTEVLFDFNLYEYDPVSKKFFKAVHSNDTDLKALINKQGANLMISVADTASQEVVEPENYAFQLGAMPQREEQDVHLATSESAKFVKKWGVTVG